MREFSVKIPQTKTEQNRGADFVRACAIEMHMDISQGHFYARIYRKNAEAQMEHLDLTPAFNTYRKNPQCGHCLGKHCSSCSHNQSSLWPSVAKCFGLVSFDFVSG